jgi:hypothetical protein
MRANRRQFNRGVMTALLGDLRIFHWLDETLR